MLAKAKVGSQTALRTFSAVALVLLGPVIGSGAVSAQQADRVYRAVTLLTGLPGQVLPPPEKWTGVGAAYRDELRDKGFVLGKNLVLEVRHADGDVSRLAAVANSIVASKPDVIVTPGTSATVAAMQATKTIPIVFSGVGDPVEKGFAASLAKPGGNLTGTAAAIGNPRLWQLLRDLAPTTRRAGVIWYGPNMSTPGNASYLSETVSRLRRDAASIGIEAIDLTMYRQEDVEPKIAELAARGDAALYIVTDPVIFAWRASILAMASRHHLPTVCSQWLEWGAAGCLATYAENPYERTKSVAGQVAKVLRGIKPADIPVELPSKFNLIINAKSAKEIGLTVLPATLAAADEVIE